MNVLTEKTDINKRAEASHIPVMMKEVLEFLEPSQGEFIIDGTLGGGGHAREIIKSIAPGGTFLGVDRDPDVINRIDIRSDDVDVKVENASYSEIPEIINRLSLPKADGILLDLGFSSIQLEEGKGFSFMKDEPLIMTYSPDDEPLMDALRQLSKKEIREIIMVSGEKYAGRIADAIWSAERKKKVKTTGELVEIIRSATPGGYERGRINPATRTFLAFRIYVNREFEHLKKILRSLPEVLKPGGTAVVITFQSLEDKIVKEIFREMARNGKVELLTKKPIPVSDEEENVNPRARSAKIRAIRMI
jgi:16S rRNA (cytosine1402-N4)-methyltransferase